MGKLSAIRVEKMRKPGRYGDGDGLFLVVSDSLRKSWVFRYQLAKKRHDMGLGRFPEVSLLDARSKTSEARCNLANGVDPIEQRQRDQKSGLPVPTFDVVAQTVVEDVGRQSTNEKVKYRAKLLLGKKFCSALLSKPINAVTAADVARVLNKVRSTRPETARKLHGLLSKVFENARVKLRDEHGISLGDLPTHLKDLKALGFDPRVVNEPHPALDWREVHDFLTALRKREGHSFRAIEFALLTACRENEVAGAEWSEIDLEERIWTIPIGRNKDRRTRRQPRRIPLSNRSVEIIEGQVGLDETWVFPGLATDSHIDPQSLLESLKKLNRNPEGQPIWRDSHSGKKIVVHGLRATFRTWAEEHRYRWEAFEESLGHRVASQVETRYRRTDILEERRELLQKWADYCSTPPSAKVIEFSPRKSKKDVVAHRSTPR